MAEWKIQPRKYDDLIDQLLFNRGIDPAEKESFFNPDFGKDLPDPYLLKGMKKAVERIKLAVEKKETVGIFADYDADGIPAAALLYKTLKAIGLKSHVYIPNRESGYGLSKSGIDILISKKCSLIITADLGIRNFVEAKYCKEKNIDLIITDHHIPAEEIPNALSVINPKIKGNKYPFKELCGCGVVYKLAQALGKEFPKEIDTEFLKSNLDLVAISTIADVVPLIGENRVLAHYGLIIMKISRNIGLRELIKIAGIKKEDINAYTVGFKIAPRINAPGRIDHATKSYELLITEDKDEAVELAMWLNEKNEDRQRAMNTVEKSAIEKIEKKELYKNNIIIVAGDWLKGVIGPSASHLVEKYSRPVILFAKDNDIYIGSARSVEGVNIVEIFEKAKDYIKKFGGHKGAAGLSVTNFEKFFKFVVDFANNFIKPENLVKKIKVDAEIKPNELKTSLCDKISQFEPFGMGNARPVFMVKNAEIVSPRLIGSTQKHMSAQIKYGDRIFRTVCFNFTDSSSIKEIKSNILYDLAFTIDINNWKGESNLDLKLVDFKPCEI